MHCAYISHYTLLNSIFVIQFYLEIYLAKIVYSTKNELYLIYPYYLNHNILYNVNRELF